MDDETLTCQTGYPTSQIDHNYNLEIYTGYNAMPLHSDLIHQRLYHRFPDNLHDTKRRSCHT